MAEHAVGLLLALARRLPRFLDGQRARVWRRDQSDLGPPPLA
jgi:phosphoglycerate dehydrogenase-like enzyme